MTPPEMHGYRTPKTSELILMKLTFSNSILISIFFPFRYFYIFEVLLQISTQIISRYLNKTLYVFLKSKHTF